MMSESAAPEVPWHPIPSSPTNATCKVYLLQAGGLTIPYDMVLLPGPSEANPYINSNHNKDKSNSYYVPDYCFLIEHGQDHYIFDLGMRKDLDALPPFLKDYVLPNHKCEPVSPAEILKKHGTVEQQAENVKACIFSHIHFDHVGDGAKVGFANAELWVGPTCCTYARPGYPVEERAPVLTDNFPTDGSRKIIEPLIPDSLLEKSGDKRVGAVEKAKSEGKYEAVTLKEPGEKGWVGLGAFDRGFDVFDDGSAYIIDAPGHSAGHQEMLIRVKTSSSGDDFLLLAGDCYHHPILLKDPTRTARPPYSKSCMHADPEEAIHSMFRTRAFAEQQNVWVLAAHDFSVGERIAPGMKEIEGLVMLNDWREKGWKAPLHGNL